MSFLGNLLDVNRNGYIDQQDLNILNAFGGIPGLDVNRNGRLDMGDVFAIAAASSYNPGYYGGYYGGGYGGGYPYYGGYYGYRRGYYGY